MQGGEPVEYSDHDLVRGVKDGDKGALDILVRRWYPRVYGYIFKIVEHEQDAYDLTQDVFIAMMQNIPNYRPWKNFDHWLFTIAHNKCMDFFRMRKRTVPEAEDVFADQAPAPPFEEAAAVSVTVRKALGSLPAPQRQAVVLHYFYQLTAGEIARRTGAPLPTVKSRLSAAKKTLFKLLREDFR